MMMPDATPAIGADQVTPTVEDTPETVEHKQEIINRIQDSMDVERDWRTRGRTIQQIYRGNLNSAGRVSNAAARYNILFSNTSILLPFIFSRPPRPDVRTYGVIPDPVFDKIAEALQKTSTSILDNTESFNAIQAAVKEVLLPGRGICRIRWKPIVEEKTFQNPDGTQDVIFEKLLDQISVEHVYWENFTFEAVNNWPDVGWVAFRHLFTKESFVETFGESPAVAQMVTSNSLDDLFVWTDKSASMNNTTNSKNSINRTSSSNNGLQDTIKKAMIWEYWNKADRTVTWICQDAEGLVLKIDDDPYTLEGFFPVPCPLLAVTTTDTLLPTPEFTIYQDLAQEIDATSERIAAIVPRLKLRGAYNSSQEELASILTADDGVMVAVAGVDYNYDLNQHIYVVSIAEHIQALNALYIAREASKQAMYDVTGISDIVRGQSKASETLGAQQMKSQFANIRIGDRRQMVEYFCRDIIRLICEIVAEHYSPESIYFASGVALAPEEVDMMRKEGLRPARIEVESDSTVAEDAGADQQSLGTLTQAMGMVLQQVFPMVQAGIMPLPIAMEMVKMVTKPFKYSSNLHQMIDASMAQMQAQQVGGASQPTQQGAPASGANVVQGPGAAA